MRPVTSKLSIQSVSVRYINSPMLAVSEASLSIKKGASLALVGESGSGKTTLAKSVCGLLPIVQGSISLIGEEKTPAIGSFSWHQHVQMIFQDPDSVFNPKRTIGWHLEEALLVWHPEDAPKTRQEKIKELLEATELSYDILHRYSFELSGGQKQRASLVRSLLVEPEYLVLDEPLASQDASKRKSLLQLLKRLQSTFHLGYLYITHDLSTLSSIADTVAVMKDGHIVEIQPTEELLTSPTHEYTKRLLSSRTALIEKELRARTESARAAGSHQKGTIPPSGT